VANAGIVAGVRIAWDTKASAKLRQQLTGLRQSGGTIEICFNNFTRSGEERLKTWGVPFQEKSRKELPAGTELMSVVEGYPGAVQFRLVDEPTNSPP